MKMTTLNDYEALFELLAGINESGGDPQVAGLDKDGRAFLANLAGPYAESVVAVMGDPWDPGIDWGGGCDECGGCRGAIWNAERLTYPVIVLEARAGRRDDEGDPMSTTPSIPGVDRSALADAIRKDTVVSSYLVGSIADAVLAYIAAHHECACDREHADEWVEVTEATTWDELPVGARVRHEWTRGATGDRNFVHRDDLPDPDPRALIARHLGTEQASTFLSWLDKNGWTVTRKGER